MKLMLLMVSLFAMVFGPVALATATDGAIAITEDDLAHHHIHNFYFNDSDKTKPNYLAMQSHAIAMSYDATTHYLAKTLPGNIDGLKRILLHNAYYIPFSIDFAKQQVKYTVSYVDANNKSTVNPDRVVWNSYPMQAADVELLKVYGCAQNVGYGKITIHSSESDAKRFFRIDKDYRRVIVNWQSRYVVESLAAKTIGSLATRNYDYLFIDDLPRSPGNCLNKESGGKGAYPTWKEGQLAFLKMVNDGAHSMTGRQGDQIKVFGNIWSPYADFQTAKWYSEKNLRLDHYYFESGGTAREDFLYGQVANGKDPETGLPAFSPLLGGYLPANRMSLGTHIETMKLLASGKASKADVDRYMAQHYVAAGVAATQGSWFGWYGETSLDKTYSSGQLIHSNAMQLLRVIPNWENLAGVPLAVRTYNKKSNVYASTNSRFSDSVIHGLNPLNGEVYAVFRDVSGKVDLMGKRIVTASFVNAYFNMTGENALPCLNVVNGYAVLTCSDKIGRGVRLSLQ